MAAFGVRDVCDVVLKSLRNIPACRSITGKDIDRGEPVVFFDSLKVSTLSGTSATVYATGGSGNQRRMAWDGDREVLFHIEDALLTKESFALMSGAKIREREITLKDFLLSNSDFSMTVVGGNTLVDFNFTPRERELFAGVDTLVDNTGDPITNAHSYDSATGILTITGDFTVGQPTELAEVKARVANVKAVIVHDANTHISEVAGELDLGFEAIMNGGNYPMFVYPILDSGDRGPKIKVSPADIVGTKLIVAGPNTFENGKQYLVDTYKKVSGASDRITLIADPTSDYYKLEGSTVFYRESDGEPLPAHLTIFKVKPRTTFELTMNPTGDPAAFAIDFDAFPQKNVPGFEKCKNGILLTLDIETEVGEDDCDCTWEA